MKFTDPRLNDTLDSWANHPEVRERACAHNLMFDERLVGARCDFFEAMNKLGSASTDQLRNTAIDYYKTYVRVSRGVPHTFRDLNKAAAIKNLAPELKLIRVEDLRTPIEKTAIEARHLIEALAKGDRASRALLDWFIDEWNTRGDILRNPRSFSAIKNECLREFSDPNWPNLLRDRLGLDHFDGSGGGPIPVALMEFEAEDILKQAVVTPDFAFSFAIPTALDSEPNSQFFPTPTVPGPGPGSLDFGCPMGLFVLLSPDELVAEVLHPRLTYKRENIAKIAFISSAVPSVGFREMRNAHLWALRIEVDRDTYGLEL